MSDNMLAALPFDLSLAYLFLWFCRAGYCHLLAFTALAKAVIEQKFGPAKSRLK